MKVVVVFLVVVVMMLAAATSFAAKANDANLNVSIGNFMLSNGEVADMVGPGLGITLNKEIPMSGLLGSLKNVKLYGNLSYVRFSNSYQGVSIKETLIPITVRAIKDFDLENKSSLRPYAGLGVGIVLMSLDIEGTSGSKTDACLELIGGTKFGSNAFAELKYLGGKRNGNTGWGLNVGCSF
ncbi:MAG: hypothetical protein WC536_04280 [Patescibacteria group bacterium]